MKCKFASLDLACKQDIDALRQTIKGQPAVSEVKQDRATGADEVAGEGQGGGSGNAGGAHEAGGKGDGGAGVGDAQDGEQEGGGIEVSADGLPLDAEGSILAVWSSFAQASSCAFPLSPCA